MQGLQVSASCYSVTYMGDMYACNFLAHALIVPNCHYSLGILGGLNNSFLGKEQHMLIV